MTSRFFAWLATDGGVWALPSNWNDLTDGVNPSQIAPGAQDSVSVMGEAGTGIGTITGPGSALLAAFGGNDALSGIFSFGTITLGESGLGGLLDIDADSIVTAVTGTIVSGSLLALAAGGTCTFAGTLALGAGQNGLGAAACNADATDGGVITVASLLLDASSAAIFVDPASLIEIGGANDTIRGALVVDAGASLAGQGDADSYADMVDNGTVTAEGGDLRVGTVTGQGSLLIDQASTLTLNGPVASGEAIGFAGANGTLALSTEFDLPSGTISGFAIGDSIDFIGSPISAATYQSTGQSIGILTLAYGSQIAATLTLAGNYANDVFLTAGDGELGTLISVTPDYNAGGSVSGGTANPDQYLWVAPGGGVWNQVANWRDETTGAQPPALAPGHNNVVTINGSQNMFEVIAGPADAASLAITGNVALNGAFGIGTLSVGVGSTLVDGTVDLLAGTTLTANVATVAEGALSAAGAGTRLSVTGTLVLGGGGVGIGLPVTYLYANAGAVITARALVIGGGSGDYVTTDTSGSIEIGGTGNAAPGTVTIDAAGTLTGNGEVNPFGAIVDNGVISAQGGALILGSVTGTGLLSIGANAALGLQSITAVPIDFAGANAVLGAADELVLPTGTITGFTPGETIDIENDPITSWSYALGASVGTLTLYYDSQVVGHLLLAGSYAQNKFLLVPDGGLGTDIQVTSNSGTGGGGGQGNTDLLAWTTPGSGVWDHAGNWTDLTTGQPAKSPPGNDNPVEVTGFTTGTYQVVGGPAACASVSFFGNTALTDAYSFGTLSIGSASVSGALALANAATVQVAGQGYIANGTLTLNGAGTALTVAGTLAIGGGAQGIGDAIGQVSAVNQAQIQAGGLSLGGGAGDVIVVDQTASIEIGTLGGAASGAITIDPNETASGNGALNLFGSVIDNGTITAIGGTLAGGNITGTGTLAIGVEATLQLTGTETCAIAFTGGGATLLLAGTEETPSGTITGFDPGDAIVTGSSPVTQLLYTPGNGGIGTLTLYYDNQVAGSLTLSGNYAGDIFTVVPDGLGAAIGVQQSGVGASGGTESADDYAWTGAAGSDWNTAGNWNDVSADQYPADVAPGINDLDTVQGPTGNNFLDLVGPANAASLTLLGNIAPTMQYNVGVLTLGTGAVLALAPTAEIVAADALVLGSVVAEGGALSVSQTLSLGSSAGSGIVTEAGGSIVDADVLILAGSGSAVALLTGATMEIGQAHDGAEGDLTVDAGALASGAGALNLTGQTVDDGIIAASGGTLTLGAVSGTGTLQIGVAATLGLDGLSAGVVIDFAGPGALIIAPGAMPASAIANFAAGDTILVPFSSITEVEYAATGAGIGTLTLFQGNEDIGALTLLGVGAGQTFTAGAYGGETQITTQPDTSEGGGGMGQGQGGTPDSGYGQVEDSTQFLESQPLYIQSWLAAAIDGLTSYVWTSPDGSSWGQWQPGYANIGIVADPVANTQVGLPPGYVAILAEGGAPFVLTDRGAGNALLVGNAGQDTIVGLGANDTLIGGQGPGSLFWTSEDGTIVGTGNDTIVTGAGNTAITGSTYRNLIFLGAADNLLTSNGTDTIIGSPGTIANDTVHTSGRALIFAPPLGQITLYANAGADTVVCSPIGGTIRMYGGSANGSNLWGGGPGSYTEYFGGQGTAVIIGDSGSMYVQGGAGAMTVYGGTGQAEIYGTPGPSAFVLGNGNSTVMAASGNAVWLAGAGNESLVASGGDLLFDGAGSWGSNVFQGAGGPVTMIGGSGTDLMVSGSGNATMQGGAGADTFSFIDGLTGGSNATETIIDFHVGTDMIELQGYAGGIQAVLSTQHVSDGNTSYTLPDGTHLILQGISGLSAASFTGN